MEIYYWIFRNTVALTGYKPKGINILAGFLGYFRYHVGYIGKDRSKKIYLKYIQEAFPQKSEKECKNILKKYWFNHQRKFLELFVWPGLTKETVKKWVKVKGSEYIDKALKEGRGVVLSVPHIGNERFLHIALSLLGYPISVVSSEYEDMSKAARDARLGASQGFHHVGFLSNSPRWMVKTLKDNNILQIASTAFGGPKGKKIDVLGQPLWIATGPSRLSIQTGAVLLSAVSIRTDNNMYTIYVDPVKDSDDIDELTENQMKCFENYIKDYPGQLDWMMWLIRSEEAMGIKPIEHKL